jgi:predicted adenine nucleotide alpha hydrolase (AANH) superfamily ATPase
MLAEIEAAGDKRPGLLLHVCCAPCSARALEELSRAFSLRLFFFNPNIFPEREFALRLGALRRFLMKPPLYREIPLIVPEYDRAEFAELSAGLESEPEGGERCRKCFALRLRRTAEEARRLGLPYAATSLTVGKQKNAALINGTGEAAAAEYGVRWLPADFKKRGGYERSLELSREYGLYRQSYCGCEYGR